MSFRRRKKTMEIVMMSESIVKASANFHIGHSVAG